MHIDREHGAVRCRPSSILLSHIPLATVGTLFRIYAALTLIKTHPYELADDYRFKRLSIFQPPIRSLSLPLRFSLCFPRLRHFSALDFHSLLVYFPLFVFSVFTAHRSLVK